MRPEVQDFIDAYQAAGLGSQLGDHAGRPGTRSPSRPADPVNLPGPPDRVACRAVRLLGRGIVTAIVEFAEIPVACVLTGLDRRTLVVFVAPDLQRVSVGRISLVRRRGGRPADGPARGDGRPARPVGPRSRLDHGRAGPGVDAATSSTSLVGAARQRKPGGTGAARTSALGPVL